MENEGMYFTDYFNHFSEEAFEIISSNGFWNNGENKNFGEIIALIHSELSEALEASRKGNPKDENLPQFDSVTVELADAVIRIMVYAYGMDMPLGEAIIEKINFNKSREYKHGGKEF